MAFQYKINKRLNKAISYYLIYIYILDINSPILLEITDIIIDNINIL
jgi:hypothetical protein